MRKLMFILFMLSCYTQATAQNPIASFEMDCSLADSTGTNMNIVTPDFPACVCGVMNEAFDLDGPAQLTVDTMVSSIVDSDFAISFYFQPTSSIVSSELLTMGNNCSSDSLLRVYYLSDMNEVVFEMSETILESVNLRAEVPSNKCWQHIIVSRENNDFYLYVNGVLEDEMIFGSDIRLGINEPFKIGHSPCTGIISNDFDGLVDQVEFFDQHIQPFRAAQLYIRNDEIITSDTTIFLGDVIGLEAVENCTGNIFWTPAIGISNTTDFITDLEGISSNAYIATFTGDFCVSRDTIDIFVIDPADVECESILLPNVFSPNGDGLNDDFGIVNGFIVEELKILEIYDRWGEVVYRSSNKNERWDGFFKGKPVNSNMLLYKVVYTCNGSEFSKTGSVSILR